MSIAPVSSSDAPTTDSNHNGKDAEQLFDIALENALDALEGPAPLIAGMARYHLGQLEANLSPNPNEQSVRGKRMRPTIALLCCAAAGGSIAAAAPLAAALELLHNFTLIHDDIQDQSSTRRHRPTVWTVWGVGQAINAGDAMFAVAHIALYKLHHSGLSDSQTLLLAEAFDRMTLEIVAGQTLDLSFEQRGDVTPSEYLTMIAGKTAAIIRYAAWAGAIIAGATDHRVAHFADFGQALGLGFQIRDDILGIWGSVADTGKEADDIHRRKQSLPILLLCDRADASDRATLQALYQQPTLNDEESNLVRQLLDKYDIRAAVELQAAEYHTQARAALTAACGSEETPARHRLFTLVESMAARSY